MGTEEDLGSQGHQGVAEQVALEQHREHHLDYGLSLAVTTILAIYLVDPLLQVEALVHQREDLVEGQRLDGFLALSLVDSEVLGLEGVVDLGLLLDVEEVGGHQLPQRTDYIACQVHSMLDPCLKMKNSLQ